MRRSPMQPEHCCKQTTISLSHALLSLTNDSWIAKRHMHQQHLSLQLRLGWCTARLAVQSLVGVAVLAQIPALLGIAGWTVQVQLTEVQVGQLILHPGQPPSFVHLPRLTAPQEPAGRVDPEKYCLHSRDISFNSVVDRRFWGLVSWHHVKWLLCQILLGKKHNQLGS